MSEDPGNVRAGGAQAAGTAPPAYGSRPPADSRPRTRAFLRPHAPSYTAALRRPRSPVPIPAPGPVRRGYGRIVAQSGLAGDGGPVEGRLPRSGPCSARQRRVALAQVLTALRALFLMERGGCAGELVALKKRGQHLQGAARWPALTDSVSCPRTSMTAGPNQNPYLTDWPEVFICHSGPDSKSSIALPIKNRLEKTYKIRVFVDEADLPAAGNAHRSMEEALKSCQVLEIICTCAWACPHCHMICSGRQASTQIELTYAAPCSWQLSFSPQTS